MDKEIGQNEPGWTFKPDGSGAPSAQGNGLSDGPPIVSDSNYIISWNASEYVSRQKNPGWFIWLGLGSFLAAAVVYLVTKDIISVVAIALLVIAVGMFAARAPKTRAYAIGEHGVLIGNQFYSYSLFKSYSILQEDAIGYVSLLPVKRFMPQKAMYYAPEDEDKVIDTLGNYLPYEERDHDLIDRLSHKIRF